MNKYKIQLRLTFAPHETACFDLRELIFSRKFSHSLREVLVPIQVNKEIINDAYILEL